MGSTSNPTNSTVAISSSGSSSTSSVAPTSVSEGNELFRALLARIDDHGLRVQESILDLRTTIDRIDKRSIEQTGLLHQVTNTIILSTIEENMARNRTSTKMKKLKQKIKALESRASTMDSDKTTTDKKILELQDRVKTLEGIVSGLNKTTLDEPKNNANIGNCLADQDLVGSKGSCETDSGNSTASNSNQVSVINNISSTSEGLNEVKIPKSGHKTGKCLLAALNCCGKLTCKKDMCQIIDT